MSSDLRTHLIRKGSVDTDDEDGSTPLSVISHTAKGITTAAKKRRRKREAALAEVLGNPRPLTDKKSFRPFRLILHLFSFAKKKYHYLLLLAFLAACAQSAMLIFGLQIAEKIINIAAGDEPTGAIVNQCQILAPFNCTVLPQVRSDFFGAIPTTPPPRHDFTDVVLTTPPPRHIVGDVVPVCLLQFSEIFPVAALGPQPECLTTFKKYLSSKELKDANRSVIHSYCQCTAVNWPDTRDKCELGTPVVKDYAYVNCSRPGSIQRDDQESGIWDEFKIVLYLVAAQGGMAFVYAILARNTGAHLTKRIRAWTFYNMMHMELGVLENKTAADVVTIIGEVDMVDQLVQMVCNCTKNLIVIIAGVAAFLLTTGGLLGAGFVVTLGIVFFMTIIYHKIEQKFYEKESDIDGEVADVALSTLVQIRHVRAQHMEDTRQIEFNEKSQVLHKTAVKAALVSAVFYSLLSIVCTAAYAYAMYRAAYLVLDSELTKGQLLIFFLYVDVVFDAVAEIFDDAEDFVQLIVMAEEVAWLVSADDDDEDEDEEEEEEDDEEKARMRMEVIPVENSALWSCEVFRSMALVLMNVTSEGMGVSTTTNENFCLKNVTLEVKQGARALIVMPQGYDQLPHLVMGIRALEQGKIFVMGEDIERTDPNKLRANVVSVSPFDALFTDSLKENVRCGFDEVGEMTVEAACKAVGVHDMIMELEEGYKSEVGEDFRPDPTIARLIVIARAVFKQPEVVFVDAQFLHLNNVSSLACIRALEVLFENRTVILLSSALVVDYATAVDSVTVLSESGTMVASGRHDMLVKTSEAYLELLKDQELAEREVRRVLTARPPPKDPN